MSKTEFMNQLESLLQGIPAAEREEALQYYYDYFDDAGPENEREVIEALGTPARVAENIKRDLLGASGDTRKAKVSDRALMKYGQEDARQDDSFGQSEAVYERRTEKEGMPAWAVAMLVTVLVFASPFLGGIALAVLGTILGLAVGWFCMIFCFGLAALILLVVLVALVVFGIVGFFVNPWAGMALVGGGLICGCLGLVFLMLTVAMAGIATPAIFRGISAFFRLFRRKRMQAARG